LVIPPAGTGGSGNPINDITNSTVTVSGITPGDVISDVNVTLTLTHTFDSDLIITLISPTGTRVTLSNRRGSFNDNFTTTVFDDQANQPISGGLAPFTGSFRPDQSLRRLFGQDPNGDWTLEINDVAAIDVGQLVSWSLEIETGTLQTVVSDGNSLDQNHNATPGEAAGATLGDVYAAPAPVNDNGLLAPPFDRTTRPLIIPGPHIVSTQMSDHSVRAGPR